MSKLRRLRIIARGRGEECGQPEGEAENGNKSIQMAGRNRYSMVLYKDSSEPCHSDLCYIRHTMWFLVQPSNSLYPSWFIHIGADIGRIRCISSLS